MDYLKKLKPYICSYKMAIYISHSMETNVDMYDDDIDVQIALYLIVMFRQHSNWYDKILKNKTINFSYSKYTSCTNTFYEIDEISVNQFVSKLKSILKITKFSRWRTFEILPNVKNINRKDFLKIKIILNENPMFHFLTGFSDKQSKDNLLQRISRSPIFDRNVLRIIWKLSQF